MASVSSVFNIYFTGITQIYCRIDFGVFMVNPFAVTATPATISTFLGLMRQTGPKNGICQRLSIGKGLKAIYEVESSKETVKIVSAEWHAFLSVEQAITLLSRMKAQLVGLENTDAVNDREEPVAEPATTLESAGELSKAVLMVKVKDILAEIASKHPTDFSYSAERVDTVDCKHVIYYPVHSSNVGIANQGVYLIVAGSDDEKELVSWFAASDKVSECYFTNSYSLFVKPK